MMPDDRALMNRIRRGDERAFALLVERHGGRLLRVATHLLGSRADGEDAVQRAFLRLHLSASAYRAEWAVSTWLYRILTNVCLDEIRRRRARPDVAGAAAIEAPVEEAPRRRDRRREPIDGRAADRAVDRLDVARALQKVPNEARALLVLRYADGLSYGELSRVRGISINTVKSQLARGKSLLRAAWEESRS
jgi:RNA polymerase sigma-70 factor (ECF subfamily)